MKGCDTDSGDSGNPPIVSSRIAKCDSGNQCEDWSKNTYCNVLKNNTDKPQTHRFYVDTYERSGGRPSEGEIINSLDPIDVTISANSNVKKTLFKKNECSTGTVQYQCFRTNNSGKASDCYNKISLNDRSKKLLQKDNATQAEINSLLENETSLAGCSAKCDASDPNCVKVPEHLSYIDWSVYQDRYEEYKTLSLDPSSVDASTLNTLLSIPKNCKVQQVNSDKEIVTINSNACHFTNKLGSANIVVDWPSTIILESSSTSIADVVFKEGAFVSFIKANGNIDNSLSGYIEKLYLEKDRIIFGLGETCYAMKKPNE
jgi:hypothetical protein